MTLLVPVTATSIPEWIRKAATAINALIKGQVAFPPLPTAPVDPDPGQPYFDTTTNKARVWDGAGWHDLW